MPQPTLELTSASSLRHTHIYKQQGALLTSSVTSTLPLNTHVQWTCVQIQRHISVSSSQHTFCLPPHRHTFTSTSSSSSSSSPTHEHHSRISTVNRLAQLTGSVIITGRLRLAGLQPVPSPWQRFARKDLAWDQGECLPLLLRPTHTHCRPGNVPTPTPATLMDIPSVKTGQQTYIRRSSSAHRQARATHGFGLQSSKQAR